jgi:TPR repeat protein|nr:MobP3 family relaxase [Flavonifractor plautii]
MPVPRVIFKCPYLKGGSERAASHLHNYVRYMATREGAQHMAIGHEQLPATEEQRKMVAQLLREFPLSRGLFEYEDYQTAPTRGNASEFITRALEDNYDQIAKRDNYVSYIASRPRAQRAGAHALFTGSDAPLVLSQIAAEVAHHPGNVWLPIISLRREDAARLGYDDAGQWKNLIAGYAMEMAEAMKIPWEQFRWYAAFHDQGHHPHIHMVCYSADGRSGYLTREGIARIKSDLAKRIFHQELHELYERQTQRRDELTQEAGVVMAELVQQMWEGTLDNPRIEQFMEHLAGKLKNLSGKKQYGYLRAPLKAVVDEIVDELARDERVARAYELWYELREEVLRTYREDLPPRLPLSRQKEFKRIRNMVIEEALRLGYESTVFDPTAPEEPPLERDIAEADREASKEPELSVDMEHIEPEETRNHRGRPSNPYARYRLAKIILADPAAEQERFRTALEWLTEAAEAGLVHAQYELGKIYRDGRGVEKDALLAAAWLTRAAEQGSDAASYALGALLLTGGEGLAKDILSALNWLRRSAEDGNQYAQYRLGRLLLRGEDAPREIEEAVRWLTASAEQGNRYAQYALGKLYLMGKEVPRDPEAAVRWFTLSAAQGNEYAQYFLDHMDEGLSIFSCATRLLHHLSGIFREQNSRGPGKTFVLTDRKLRQRIREKKIAMGHKPDDHEDAEISMR